MCGGGSAPKAPKEDPEAKAERERQRAQEIAELEANKEKQTKATERGSRSRQGTRSLLDGGSARGFGTNFYQDE